MAEESRFPVPTQTCPFSTHSPCSRCVCVCACASFVGDHGGPSFILSFPLSPRVPPSQALLSAPLSPLLLLHSLAGSLWKGWRMLAGPLIGVLQCCQVYPLVSAPLVNMHWRSRPLPLSHSAAHNTPSSAPRFQRPSRFLTTLADKWHSHIIFCKQSPKRNYPTLEP